MTISVAFLSTERLEGFFVYDQLTYPPLRERGIEVEAVPWRATEVDWERFAAVVVRSTWDYQDEPAAFLEALERIDRSSARLFNPLATMKWNLDKSYLGDLAARGVAIVPTAFEDELRAGELARAFDRFGVDELVVKPRVSANADRTFRLHRDDPGCQRTALEELRGRPALVQPFMSAIVDEGEYSLFYFGGRYSHAILKTPADGDFRVQEEHGGRLRAIRPQPELLQRARSAMDSLPGPTLYARLDFVREPAGDLLLMEAELIEPSLYFQLDQEAPKRFADALCDALDSSGPGRIS